MKKLAKILVLIMLLTQVMGLNAFASDATSAAPEYASGDYKYILLPDGTAEVTGYTGKAKNLEIPDSLAGKIVTSIGEEAFYWCSELESLTIPDSVTHIGDNAFYNCYTLSRLTLPDSATYIGNSAFYGCFNLKNITITNNVTYIGDYAFGDCINLKNITIPDSVTTIDGNPFAGCSLQIKVSPDHPVFATIDGVLFDKTERKLVSFPYSDATNYTIPNGIKAIGTHGFAGCGNLESLTIPDSVTHIGSYAFGQCGSLKTITIPNNVTRISEGTFFCCYNLENITIPNNTTYIGDGAFFWCYELKSLTIPDSVAHIGDYTFDDCNALTLTVGRNSYAKQYAVENNLSYTYPDILDWLND